MTTTIITTPDERQFLDALSDAQTINIHLTEHRQPHNFMQAYFRLTVATIQECFTLERPSVRTSSWPVHKFLIPGELSVFFLAKVLPAVISNPNLQSLSLDGCGRVQGFYPLLMQNLSNHPTLVSLSLASWADFIEAGVSLEQTRPLLAHLQTFSVNYPKFEEEPARLLGEALSRMSQLQNLSMNTGVGQVSSISVVKIVGALSSMSRLQDLRWVAESLPAFEGDSEHLLEQQIFGGPAITRLELAFKGGFKDRYLASLLKRSPGLIHLSLSDLDIDAATVLGQYLLTNSTLQSLHLSLSDQDSCCVPLLEGTLRHRTLSSLALHNVSLSLDVAKTMQMLLVYNTTLQNLQVSCASTSNGVNHGYMQDLLLGLHYNTSLRTVTLGATCPDLDWHTSLTLQDVLLLNTTLRHLHLGDCHVQNEDCARVICQGIICNDSLLSMTGIVFGEHQGMMVDALSRNKTLCLVQPCSAEMEFYLTLNRMGRVHLLEPNGMAENLLPHVLAKASSSVETLHYMIQARAEIFGHRQT
jgi:hypothetical protein